MQIIQTNTPIFIYTALNHKEHKDILLNGIDLFIKSKDTELRTKDIGSNTTVYSDWNYSKGDYLDYFCKHILPPQIAEVTKNLNLDNWEIHNGWFQQYTEFSEHSWHNHPNCHYSNVYYLELPDTDYVTELLDVNNKPIKLNAKEGDIITFPSHLLHRSKPNGNKRKTIISYNSSFSSNDNVVE